MSTPITSASPCHVRYVRSGERFNVIAWLTDPEADVGAVIVRDGRLEVLWMSQQHNMDNIAFQDGPHVGGES